MSSINKVLIVGGGIGGLSLGIALRRKGIEAEIVELQKEFDVYGVGIIQQANALRALDANGKNVDAFGGRNIGILDFGWNAVRVQKP